MASQASSRKQGRTVCDARTAAGDSCQRVVWVDADGTTYNQCRWHLTKGQSEELDKLRHANALAGGRTKRNRAVISLDQQSIKTSHDIAGVLAAAITALNDGELDARRCQALTGLSGACLKALEMSMTEGRLAALEQRLGLGDGNGSSTVSEADEAGASEWVIQGKNGAES